MGDEGLQQMQQFPKKFNNTLLRDAEYDARCADSGAIDPDLPGLIRAWPRLSESVRKEILKRPTVAASAAKRDREPRPYLSSPASSLHSQGLCRQDVR